MAAERKAILKNTAFTIGGALVLNGVLQFFIYPRLAYDVGAEANGTILSLMALVNILGPSIGQALNNSRLVLRRDMDVSNGDYNTVILLFSAVGAVISLIYMWLVLLPGAGGAAASMAGGAIPVSILLILLIFMTDFRYYGDVEYRLSLKYGSYFLYYLICSLGYAAGFLLYRFTGNWPVVFLTGEICAFCFILLKGTIYRDFLRRSLCFGNVVRSGGLLVLSYLVTNLTLNIDRLFLNARLGGEAVSIYYVVSLIGKTLVLFVAPVNTIIISYLTKEGKRLGRKRFLVFAAAGAAVSLLFLAFCAIATPIFVRLFYPQLADRIHGLVVITSAAQVLAMYSAYLFIIVLTFTSVRWQLALQIAHLILLIVLMFPMTAAGGMKGFALAVLIAGLLRVLAVLLLGVLKAGTDDGKQITIERKRI